MRYVRGIQVFENEDTEKAINFIYRDNEYAASIVNLIASKNPELKQIFVMAANCTIVEDLAFDKVLPSITHYLKNRYPDEKIWVIRRDPLPNLPSFFNADALTSFKQSFSDLILLLGDSNNPEYSNRLTNLFGEEIGSDTYGVFHLLPTNDPEMLLEVADSIFRWL